MAGSKVRRTNERFFDEYKYFDSVLCERLNVKENGVILYMAKMKEAYIEAKEAIPEWDITYKRLAHMKKRFANLENDENKFNHFQGKDEDVVWMQVFYEKLDAGADPLSKYATLDFSKKKKSGNILQKLFGIFK